jgi:hypothetical protein
VGKLVISSHLFFFSKRFLDPLNGSTNNPVTAMDYREGFQKEGFKGLVFHN